MITYDDSGCNDDDGHDNNDVTGVTTTHAHEYPTVIRSFVRN